MRIKKVVHYIPESAVQYKPESIVHYIPEYSPLMLTDNKIAPLYLLYAGKMYSG